MKAPLLASLALFLLACTAHAAPLRSSSSNLVFKQVVLFWKFLAVSEAFSVVIHGAAALPRASCVVSATDFNATLTFVSTRNSISPPYGFGVSATVTVSGSKALNNSWAIREWAPIGGDCAKTGFSYVPDIETVVGPLMTGTWSSSEFALVGPKSVIGRSIVVFNPDMTILGCCPILFADDLTPNDLAPTATSNLQASCTFFAASTNAPARDVSGTAVITTFSTTVVGFDELDFAVPPNHWGSRVNVSVSHTYSNPLNIHIHEYPSAKFDCGDAATGGHYNPNDGLNLKDNNILMGLAELSNKHGQVVNGTAMSYIDHQVRLDGQFGVNGRSLVLHSTDNDTLGARVGCCNIPFVDTPVPAFGPSATESVEALCELTGRGDVKGWVHFKQPSSGGSYGVQITASITFTSASQTLDAHDWRIHERYAGIDAIAGECELSGNTYTPSWEFLGPSAIQAQSGMFYSGNLGFKNGFLKGDQGGAEVVFNDGGLSLSGPKSVIGRSLKIYPVVGTAPALANNGIGCCNIVRIPYGSYRATARTAVCSFAKQTLTGDITFTQNSPSEGTSISFNVAGATDVLNYTVNQNGIVGGSCASAGDVFVNSNGQSVGDLTSRLGVFGASAVKFDEKVTLGGVNSVLGRSVVLTSSTGTIAGCCTVGFKSGPEPEVRYRYMGTEATCSFSDDLVASQTSSEGVEGWIRFRQLALTSTPTISAGTEIEVNVIGSLLSTTTGVKSLTIRDGSAAVCSESNPIYEPADGLGAAPYTVGRLGLKHGNFSGDRWNTRFIDNAVSLLGSNSVMDRTVLISDDAGSPVICCNISNRKTHPAFVSPTSRPPVKAACVFEQTDVKGTIMIEDTGSAVTVQSNPRGFYFAGAQVAAHNYHIHSYGLTDATLIGGHYRPTDYIGPDANGIPFPKYTVQELGDLSGKHGVLNPEQGFSYVDNQVQLSGSLSVLGRSIAIHAPNGGSPYASCIITAVDSSYIAVDPTELNPVVISQCNPGETFRSFVCVAGVFTASGVITIAPNTEEEWQGYNFVANGITLGLNASLTIRSARLVSTFLTVNENSQLKLVSVEASVSTYTSYGGLFNLAGATLNVTGQWDEPLCKPLLATPSPQTVVRYPPSITLVDAKTRVTVNTFSPCGDLRIDASSGNPTTLTPFTYTTLNGRFTKISFANGGACNTWSAIPTYNMTELSLQTSVSTGGCASDMTMVIIYAIIAAVVLGIIIAVVVIIFTPAGIPCRIWYRKTCGAKFSPSGRNTQGF